MADREALKKWLKYRADYLRSRQGMRTRGTRPLGGGPGTKGPYSPKTTPLKPSKNPYGRPGPEKRYY